MPKPPNGKGKPSPLSKFFRPAPRYAQQGADVAMSYFNQGHLVGWSAPLHPAHHAGSEAGC